MVDDRTHALLAKLAKLKAQAQGHTMSPMIRTFHRLGSGAHCEGCYRMAYVFIDVSPPLTDGRAIKEACPKAEAARRGTQED